jgi:CBS domain-containing protein
VKVQDIMRRDVITVRPETPLKEVARLLVEHRISGVPVVDAEGRVLGVVSEADLVVKERGTEGERPRLLDALLGGNRAKAVLGKVEARTAGDAMTTPAVTIEPGAPVRAAAARMVERQVNRLPVVEDGRLVGIVTRADIVRTFVRSDAELEREVVEGVILRAMWLDPHLLEVAVENGVVRIRGRVDRRSDARILEELVRRVEGVVDVEVAVEWNVDDERRPPPPGDIDAPAAAAR